MDFGTFLNILEDYREFVVILIFLTLLVIYVYLNYYILKNSISYYKKRIYRLLFFYFLLFLFLSYLFLIFKALLMPFIQKYLLYSLFGILILVLPIIILYKKSKFAKVKYFLEKEVYILGENIIGQINIFFNKSFKGSIVLKLVGYKILISKNGNNYTKELELPIISKYISVSSNESLNFNFNISLPNLNISDDNLKEKLVKLTKDFCLDYNLDNNNFICKILNLKILSPDITLKNAFNLIPNLKSNVWKIELYLKDDKGKNIYYDEKIIEVKRKN